MNSGSHKEKTETIFDSVAICKGRQYGLKASDSGESYFIYELVGNRAEFRVHLNVKKGTRMELACEDDHLGVSKLMGHAKEIITLDIYGDNAQIIADGVEEIQPFMNEVMP